MRSGLLISGEKPLGETLDIVLSDMASLRKVATPHEAFQMLAVHSADFAILDSSGKDNDTEDTVDKLLKIQDTLSIIVLVPSLYLNLVETALGAGAYLVVEKPFDRKIIRELVERAVERSELLVKIAYLTRDGSPQAGRIDAHTPGESQYFYREVLRRFAKAMAQVLDYQKLLQLAVEAVIETFNASRASLFLLDRTCGRYVPAVYNGYPQEFASMRSFEHADTLPAWLAKHNRILINRDTPGAIEFDLFQQMTALGAELITGLHAKGKLIGFIAIGARVTGKVFTDDDIELLSLFSNYLAVGIENALLYRDIARGRAHTDNVLHCIRTGIVAIDSHGIVTIFNKTAEEILGIAAGDVIGKRVEKICSVFADLLLRTLMDGTVYSRHEIVSPTNKKTLGVNTAAMRDEEGCIDGALMSFADLSRIKVLEEKEEDLERVQFWSRLAARLAHEVKNPLVPIKTFAQLLPIRYGDKEFREEFRLIVNREVERLNDIVRQLATFANSPHPDLRTADIRKVIDLSLGMVKEKLISKNVTLVTNFGENTFAARVDVNLLSQAFLSILDNATDAVAEGGKITIAAARANPAGDRNGVLTITFTDNGKGMGEEELRGLFTPFVTSKTQGMGLGLAIARRIIRDHRGSINIESPSGRGCVVKVVIPGDGN